MAFNYGNNVDVDVPDGNIVKTPTDLLVWDISIKHDAMLQAIEEDYDEPLGRGAKPRVHRIRAKVLRLYRKIFPAMMADKKFSAEKLPLLRLCVRSYKPSEVVNAASIITCWLYDKKLLKFDNRVGYNQTDLSEVLKNYRR